MCIRDRNYSDVASNYAESYVQAWASEEGIDLETVKADLTYDRNVVEDEAYNWRDIDSTKLFNELRRSPLMVYYFKAPTGPLNTCLLYTSAIPEVLKQERQGKNQMSQELLK